MTRIRTIGFCLLVAFLLSAPAAGLARAEAPEYGRCLRTSPGVGVYGNSSCTAVGGEKKYEWHPGIVKAHFTTKLKELTVAVLETVSGSKVTCHAETSTGEFTGRKTVGGVVVRLGGCEALEPLGVKCGTVGANEGEIVSTVLEGELGIEQVSNEGPVKNKLGFVLFPRGREGLLAEFSCGGGRVEVRGAVIDPVPANRMMSKITLKYAASKGHQEPERFEGGPVQTLESSLLGGPFEQAGQSIAIVQTTEEKVETNSVV
jgi:hypothetical protein